MEQRIQLPLGARYFPCILTQPDYGSIQRVVLGIHGLGGSACDEIQKGIAEEMEMFSSAAMRFDFPGHGDSPLSDAEFTLDNCREMVLAAAQYARRNFPQVKDLCIFATGFGAYITLITLERILALPGTVKLVVQTPSVLMHETLLAMRGISQETFCAMDRMVFQTARPFAVTYSFYESMKENIALNTYPIPILILQGEEDAFIRQEDINNFRRINEQSKLVVIPGASHRFLEDGAWDMVLDLTRDWFAFEQVLLADWK